MKHIYKHILFIFFAFFTSCIEEITLETKTTFNSLLVIEGTLTNVLKPQTIKLSRSFKLETDGPSPVSNASVMVFDELGNTFTFIETDSGTYHSIQQFAAEPNISYTLEVIVEGVTYISSQESFSQPTSIDDLIAERSFNENSNEGVSILLNSFDPTGDSKFYRFTFEETYKVIAPKYSPLDLIPGTLALVPKEEQQQICYATDISNSIIQQTTTPFNEDRLTNFKVRFINRDNAIISHRYSILVTQYVQSAKGHQFYKTLSQLSSEGSLFSQLQPGFLEGNITSSNTDMNEDVIGYFEVSPVDSKRIFFNYTDLFPNELLPPYFISCTEFAPKGFALSSALEQGFKYFRDNEVPLDHEGFYFLVPPACGNCTVLGSNEIPSFWIE